ncbi:MAG TPA: PAS domain S-box protein [Polyangiaceae bacterium]|jgi:two-component system cell cycle sensor histidine kinase/response regulator CckA|nr:PAS domain S-box protein [Polyangiaceae bacterium]
MLTGRGPWFQGAKLDAFRAYWALLEANYDTIVASTLREAVEIAPSLSKPASAERAREDGSDVLKRVWHAIREGDWTAVEEKWEARGAAFATLGVSIEEWSEIVLLTSRCSLPFVLEAHGRDLERLGAILATMSDFWSRSIRVARAQYARTRDEHLASQKDALRRSEARYARLAEAGIVGVVISEMGPRILEANDAFLRMLGYTRDDLRAGLRWDALTPPEWRVSEQVLDDLRRSGVAQVREKEYLHKDGRRVPVLVGAARFEPDEAITFVLDQSDAHRAAEALRRSERLFRAVVESSPDAVSLLDRDGRFIYASPAAVRIAGLVQGGLVGTSVFDLIAPADLEAYRNRWQECVDNPNVRLRHDFELRPVDGVTRSLESIRTNHLDDPNLGAIVTLVRDVTDRRRLEEQLRQSQKLEAVGKLAGGVAHDFNNLLSVILSYCDLLAPGFASSPAGEDLREIRRAGESAASLTKQLLAFSRKQVMSPKVIDLSTTINEMDRMMRRLIGDHIELVTLAEEHLGRVKADPHQLEQVVMNLVVNARDAMPQGGKLVVETANVELDPAHALGLGVPAGPYVRLAVSDTGEGMVPAVLERVFDPFFSTKGESGTGLGLATVFGIVRQSGGAISVYSEPGRGTTFKLYFPRTTEDLQPTAVLLPAATAAGGETVLLVDDSEPVRTLVHQILERQGYRVIMTSSPADALLAAEEHPGEISLLLTDVVMPKMTGRQLAERLLRIRPAIKVLYMSGYTENTVVHGGTLDPGIAFLPKPITPAALLQKVRETIAGG